jgi:coniferyl-aldehyde dehydrogenase
MTGMSNEIDAAQRASDRLFRRFDARGGLTLDERSAALRALREGLIARKETFVKAISADFGYRSRHETLATEVVVVLQAIDYTLPRLARWARPRRLPLSPPVWSARAWGEPTPRGVACVMAPSNYPLQLALMPLISALSAGCPTLIKPSEMTPRTADEIAALAAAHLDAQDVGVVCGGPALGERLASLPFGVILFTGSSTVGAKVASAAAPHLTPLILELGGKSPGLIDRDAKLAGAAETIIAGKLMNAGQTCVAPDYVLTPADRYEETLAQLRAAALRLYPDAERRDYSSLNSPRAHARLQALEAGLDVAPLFDASAPRYRPALALNPPLDHPIMREEIFGPLLPVIPYQTLDDAIAIVRALPDPLALYWFGDRNARFAAVLQRTRSGAVAINETVLQAGLSQLPFGGVGLSGYGRYHGLAGFQAFSHERVVFEQSRFSVTRLLRPPFGRRADRLIGWLTRAPRPPRRAGAAEPILPGAPE